MTKPVRTKIVQTLSSESSVQPELMEYEMRRAEAYVAMNLLRNIQRTMLHMFPNITEYKNIYRLYKTIEQKNGEVANLIEGNHSDPIAAMFASKINLTGIKLIPEDGPQIRFERDFIGNDAGIQVAPTENPYPIRPPSGTLPGAAMQLAQQVENDYEAAQRHLAEHVALQERAAAQQMDALRGRSEYLNESQHYYISTSTVSHHELHIPDEDDPEGDNE